ncbi:MAG: type II toxin-antitoxin system VapB family antitoxin [Chloroflexota bacterium]|nr:type II toxin-antitoxin system VapB family antitoxin [Chloroflexota bacterium]
MTLAKLFTNGRSQAVRLPKGYRFKNDDEVVIKKIDGIVMLIPKSRLMDAFTKSLDEFPEDFAIDRSNDVPQERNPEV